jgi:hypothetical protein
MISVFRPVRTRVVALPEYCYLVGACGARIPVRVTAGRYSRAMIVLDLETGKAVVFDPMREVDALIPEAFEDAKWDIALDLLNKGII